MAYSMSLVCICAFLTSPRNLLRRTSAPEKEHLTDHLPVLWLLCSQTPDSGAFTTVTRPKRKELQLYQARKQFLNVLLFHVALYKSYMNTFSF